MIVPPVSTLLQDHLMKEPPHPTLLDRDAAAKAIAEGYGPQLDMLTDMVNYASNLIPRAYEGSERKLRDVIVCFVLLKQFASMLDAVEVLLRAGAVHAAFVPARAAFEASLYVEWMLVSDGEKKAAYYFVGNVRAERLWGMRVVQGTPESAQFLEEMRQLGDDILSKYSSLDAEGRMHVIEADAILKQPSFTSVNDQFEAWMSAHSRAGRPPLHEPDWYKVLGKPSIRSIAKELQRLPEYLIYYGKGSQVVHSSTYKQHVQFDKGGTVGHPIRSLSDAHTLLNFVFSNAMQTFMRVLAFYRNRELAIYGRKYMEDWRNPFTHIPSTKIESVSAKRP